VNQSVERGVVSEEACATCGLALKVGAQFCGGCGLRRAMAPADRGELRMVISLYVGTLLLAAAWMIYFRITEQAFTTAAGATIAFTLLTLVYAARHRDLIAAPSSHLGFAPGGYALILGASVPIVLLVAGYVSLLGHAFGMHPEPELRAFEARSVVWPLLLLVVLPPLGEELTFRGLIFGGLRQSLTVKEAVVVSSFAFAILHLSVPSLVTHLPLGLYFCWLRYRSQSLWPGVFAHACHNLGVCVLEWSGFTG
jgi:uncharacterized protein